MSDRPFLFKAVAGDDGDQKSVTMNAVDWKRFFGKLEEGQLDEYAAYQAIAWTRRCVELRANALSTIPVSITRGGTVVEDWEYADLLPALLWKAEASLQLYGASYWIRQRNVFGMDKWLRWMLPTSIKPKIDSVRGLTGFERKLPEGDKKLLAVKDVVYVWQPSLEAEIGPGPGWVSTALVPSQLSQNMGLHSSAFFERGAIPAVILSVNTMGTSRDELDRLESWWKRVMSGVKRAFETVAVKASVEPKIIGYPTKDLAMTELSLLVRQQIATAAGVPQTMLEDAANFATAQEHHQAFYTETVVPQARLIEDSLNVQVFDPLGLELKLDYQAMDIFQEDEQERSAALKHLVDTGLPIDLAMEILGFDLPDGMDYAMVAARIEADNARKLAEARETITLQAQSRQQQQPAPEQQGAPMPTRAVRDELDRWKRKSLSALKAGQSWDVPFETDIIGESEQKAIHDALAAAGDAEEVKAAFERPFRGSAHDHEGETYP